MKIDYQPCPFMTETSAFANFDKQAVRDAGTVIVEVRNNTKTRLWISLRHKSITIGVNFVPPGSEKFKFHYEVRNNMFSGRSVPSHYFVISKKQALPQLEEHIYNVVKNVFSLDADSEFTIVVWQTPTIREMQHEIVK